MNIYKHHIGDYDSATGHLSWDEDHAYTRLLRVYYRLERPLPPDTGEICRLVRARTSPQRQAVERVLREFFELRDDGWHNKRSDEEIATYRAQADTNRRIARQRIVHEPSHEPSTNRERKVDLTNNRNRKPVTGNQEPDKSEEQRQQHSGVAKSARLPANGITAPLWSSYATAHEKRYGVEPVRNAKVNGQLAQFLQRVPQDEAPDIAAFYVSHNKGLYVSARHCVDLLLRDAEGLRTEWFTGRRVTETAARQADQTAARGDVFNELIEEARREKTA